MERVIEIDGRPVKFRATAAIPRMYRMQFGRDVLLDIRLLQTAMEAAQKKKAALPPQLLGILENLAYCMAKHADPSFQAETVEAWLEGFGPTAIYEALPQLVSLWRDNNTTSVSSKKKPGPPTGK